MRYYLITACFMIDIVLFCIVRFVLQKESYFYNSILGLFLLCIVAFLSLNQPLKKIHWRRSLVISWFGFCLMITVSDFLVYKKACGLGLILALVFTGVFFVWQNHPDERRLMKCFKDAVKIAFYLIAIISVFFRPFIAGGRYAALFTNPNTFGLYLVTIFVVFVCDLECWIQKKKSFKKLIPTIFSIALVLFYVSISQARTALIAVIGVFVTWVIARIIVNRKSVRIKQFIIGVGATLICTVACYPVFYQAVTHIPYWIGHPIVFADDTVYYSDGSKAQIGEMLLAESVGVDDVFVEETDGGYWNNNFLVRIFNSLDAGATLDRISSGRITIYKAYLRKLNFKGHRNISMKINDHKVAHSHNNYVQFGYTYGYLSMFFYFLITVLSVLFAAKHYLKNFRKSPGYSFLALGISVSFVLSTLTECLFLPFEVFPAFAYWFTFCDLFVKRVAKNKREEAIDEQTENEQDEYIG